MVQSKLIEKPKSPITSVGGANLRIEMPAALIADISLSAARRPKPSSIPAVMERGATVTKAPGKAFARTWNSMIVNSRPDSMPFWSNGKNPAISPAPRNITKENNEAVAISLKTYLSIMRIPSNRISDKTIT